MTSDDEIITVADTPDFTYTANTKENVIYKAVGKSVVDDYTWNVYVDGDEQACDDLAPDNDKATDYAYTAKGATTEIYVDDVNDTVTVVMINHYMAEVTKVKDGENTVRVLSNKTMTNPIDERTIIADGFAKGDYVVVTVDVNDDDDSFIASIADPATAEGSVTYVAKASEPEDEDKGSYVKLTMAASTPIPSTPRPTWTTSMRSIPLWTSPTVCIWTPTAMSLASWRWMTTMPTICMWIPPTAT